MNVVVSGVGLVSALGIGAGKAIDAIRSGRSGISRSAEILETSNRLPVGELRLSNETLHELAGIPLKEHLSRTALLGILAVREALADARVDFSRRVGLVSATSVGGMDLTEHFYGDFMENEHAGRLRDVRMHDCAASTDAIAKYCGINSYSTTVSTACSSAANAILFGERLIRHGLLDYVVVGGTDALSAFTLNGFKSLMILDPQPCRPFDESRAGLNLGEGAGFLVLQAEGPGECYCRLAGCANSNDAHHQTASSAEGNGAFLSMSKALEKAGISPADVSYVNAHGTGTGNNDASESAAMVRLFGDRIPPFSSTKAFTGHTLAAAGGIEAVLSALAVKNGYLYPNLNFMSPIPETGLVPVTEFREGCDVSCVVSNSFGFGGNCSSIVLAG